MTRRCVLFFLLFVSGLVQAATVTIDFESAALGTTEVIDQGYRISGFSFGDESRLGVADDSGDQFFEAFSYVYEPMCACSASGAAITLEKADGSAFAYYSSDWTGYQESVLIEGLLSNGSFAADPVGTGDWLNVASVRFSAEGPFCTTNCYFDFAGVEVDNIVVGSAVPVPAAAWLFGSALAGMGWLRRKRTV